MVIPQVINGLNSADWIRISFFIAAGRNLGKAVEFIRYILNSRGLFD